MPTPEIRFSTNESIPGEPRTATRSEVAWIESAASVKDAYRSLEKWARENNCDAIAGFRLIAVPYVKSSMRERGNEQVYTTSAFTSYGTCIAY